MGAYISALRGYIADVPEVFFKRIDGNVFHFDEITQASATPNVQFTEVNAGWGLYPVAYLPAQSTLEIQLTSGQFDSRLFNLANGGEFEADDNYKEWKHERVTVISGPAATLSTTLAVEGVTIAGLTESSGTPAAGSFAVAKSGTTTTISFNAADVQVGAEVDVDYQVVRPTGAMTLDVTNDRAAIGEAILKWPIYNGGENITNNDSFGGASVMGYMIMRVYRARVTAMPKRTWAA